MSSATKAGLIVGGLGIVIALVILVVASNKGETPEKEATQVDPASVGTHVEQTEAVTGVSETTTTEKVDAQLSQVEIDEESLAGLTTKQDTEVGFIANKHIYLQGDQLHYALGVMLGDNRVVTYYVSESGYYLLNVNDKVSVSYTTYTNANGLSFIQVASVTTIE